jgi:hypothetical protein
VLFTVTGITNRSRRAQMAGLLHRPCSMDQASYELACLARNGLAARVSGALSTGRLLWFPEQVWAGVRCRRSSLAAGHGGAPEGACAEVASLAGELIGRDEELAAIAAFLDGVESGP